MNKYFGRLNVKKILAMGVLAFFLAPVAMAQGSAEANHAYALLRVHGDIRLGQSLSSEEVIGMEKQLAQENGDLEIRTKLVGYYGDYRYWQDTARRKKYQEHVLWLIRNEPRSALMGTPYTELTPFKDKEVYDDGRKAWLEQVERWPEDVSILANAGSYFTLHDRELAIGLIETLARLESSNPTWPAKLGHLHDLNMSGRDRVDSESALKALAAYERALKLTNRGTRVAGLLQSLAKVSFAGEQFENARKYARRLVDEFATSQSAPTSIHYGNTVLGRLAVRRGEIEGAKEHLLVSGRVGSAPTLSSFGPSMALAQDLLELEEWDVVGEYLDLCAKFWKSPRASDQLEEWKAEIREKRLPDFGGNATR